MQNGCSRALHEVITNEQNTENVELLLKLPSPQYKEIPHRLSSIQMRDSAKDNAVVDLGLNSDTVHHHSVVEEKKNEVGLAMQINDHKEGQGYELPDNECGICLQIFPSARLLIQHWKKPCHLSVYLCRVCGKDFYSKHYLTLHSRTHTGESLFKCKSCGKGFNRPSNLAKHEKSHTGDKPYTCVHCKKSFTRQDNLKKHIKTHRK